NAWLLLGGMETLFVRMERQCASAQKLAEWLQNQPSVRRVHYPGLSSHPQYELARRQQSAPGAIVSFDVEGGRDAAWKIIDSAQLISRTGNLGDVKTTITHPATTTHGRLSQETRDAAGVGEGLLRLSVGLEHPDDLIADLARGLEG
ncbi:MAG: PLP-dependent transferase, partial [Microvirgula sp.]